MKPTPTATNNRTMAASGVMNGSPTDGGRRGVILLPQRRIDQQSAPAGEAGVQLVPVSDLRLAQAPAQVDDPAVHLAGEVHQPHERVLQLDADLAQLALVLGHLL